MEAMKLESNRLATFHNGWPVTSPVQPRALAQAGFYYTGTSDRVKCAFCHGMLKAWEKDDHPWLDHQRCFPNCSFIKGHDVGNISDCATPTFKVRVAPKYPEYENEETRLQSFRNWPSVGKRSPMELTKSGFFYSGSGDRVKCFSCGVNLTLWKEDDDPWVSHGRWSPACEYLKWSLATSYSHMNQTNYRAVNQNTINSGTRQDGAFVYMCTDETPYPHYGNLDQRLESFNAIQPLALNSKHQAAAGFFYQSPEKKIRCYCCGITLPLSNWNDQNLFAVHKNISPSCRYITSLPNVCLILGLQLDENLPENEIHRLLQLVTEPVTADVPGIVTTYQESVDVENKRLKEQKQCQICKNIPVGIVFLPCGHLVCCVNCSTPLRECIICCSRILARVKSSLE